MTVQVKVLLMLLSLAAAGLASAQVADAGGFVTQCAGEVTVLRGGRAQPLAALAVLQPGERVKSGPGARVQVLYLTSGRQETWSGAADFLVADEASRPVSGVPQVKRLPDVVVQALAASHEVFHNPQLRQSMVRLRTNVARAAAEAESRYAELRAQAAGDDITPELYLLGVLDGIGAGARMAMPLAELLRRQPEDPQVRALHAQYQRWMAEEKN